MKLLQKILVAMDFGDASVNALKYAVEVADAFHSKIYVLHVINEAQLSSETEEMMRDFLHDKFVLKLWHSPRRTMRS